MANGSSWILVVDDNYLYYSFLPPDRSHTRSRVPHLALPVPLVSMALVPLLPSSSRILDSDPFRGPGLFILCTILLRVPLAAMPYPASNCASPSIDFGVVRGFVGLLIPDPLSVFHATSLQFPMLRPGLKSTFVTAPSSGVLSNMPQTTSGAAHPLASY